jgi:hypothetical protein
MRTNISGRKLLMFAAGLTLVAALAAAETRKGLVSMFLGFNNSEAALNRGLPEKDFAFHPQNTTFCGESKFFLGQFESGHTVFANFLYAKAGPIRKNVVNIAVVTPDKERYFFKEEFPDKEFITSTETCTIKAGKNYTEGKHPDFKVHVEDKNLMIDMVFHNEVPQWRPGDGRVWFDKERFYDICTQSSRAVVTGKLVLRGKETQLKGMGYCDHSYGNILSTDQASFWYSMRAFGKENQINYLEFVTPEKFGNTRVPWIMITDEKRMLYATTAVDMVPSDFVVDEGSGYSYPMQMDLKVNDGTCELTAKMRPKELVERFDIFQDLNFALRTVAKMFISRPIIFRFMSDFDIEFKLKGMPEKKKVLCTGVHEVLFVK